MHSAEKKWFEAELEGNPGLKKELELRMKVNKYVDNQDAIAFRQTLINAELRHKKEAAKRKVAAKQIIQYAAIFAGLILIGTISFYVLRDNSGTNVATTYSPDYTPLTVSRSEPADMDMAYLKATEYYKAGDYSEAIRWFNQVDNANMQVEFLRGSSYMKIDKYNRAIGYFRKVVKDNDNLYVEDASFYLGVCYIQTDQSNMARKVLEGILNTENRHKKEAKKLLRKIN